MVVALEIAYEALLSKVCQFAGSGQLQIICMASSFILCVCFLYKNL